MFNKTWRHTRKTTHLNDFIQSRLSIVWLAKWMSLFCFTGHVFTYFHGHWCKQTQCSHLHPCNRDPRSTTIFFSEALTRIQEWLNKSCLLLNSKKQCLYLPNNQLRWCTLICSCKVKCTRLQMSLNILNSSVSCKTLEFTKQRTQGCSGLRGQAESLNSHKETQGQTLGVGSNVATSHRQ